MKKTLALVLALMMVLGTMSGIAFADNSVKTIAVYTATDGLWGECGGPANESFEIKVYSGDTLIGTAALNNYEGIIDGDVYVTWHLKTVDDNDPYWTYKWEAGHPRLDYIPTRAEHWVDGALYATGNVQMNGPDGLWPVKWEDVDNVSCAAMISGKKYATLQDAIDAAVSGDTIVVSSDITVDSFEIDGKKLIIDLAGHTMYLRDVNSNNTTRINHKNGADVTYANGTIDVTGAVDSVDFFGTGVYDGTAASMTFDNVEIVGDGYNSGYAVFYLHNNPASTLKIVNSTINLANEQGASGGVIKAEQMAAKVTIANTTMTLENIQRGIVSTTTNISNSDITIKNSNKTALRNFNGTITDSVVNIDNCDFAIENDNGSAAEINLAGTTSFKATNSKTNDILIANANTTIKIAETAELVADSVEIDESAVVEGNLINKADSVYVQFAKTDVDAAGSDNLEGADTYDIILLGGNAETINELASADLSFVFDPTPVADGAMSYEITPAEGVTLTKIADRYMFNYDGVAKYEETGVAIKIGAVKFEGYGAYNFSTADVTTNAVYATEIRDNIVDGFEDAANLIINADAVNNDGMIGKIEDVEIAVPTRKLTINIAFPNAVENNAAAYQAMSVRVVGGNYDETFALGTDGKDYNFALDLPYNAAYTVTVSGAGYRTARYTVTLNDNKTLNFWNNVMDEEKVVEVGKDSSKTKVTFLAGDIVKDNNINIYDLSAVVSYFATEMDTTVESGYAKYDLNRDGVIDSKDVAYVLVSWNN